MKKNEPCRKDESPQDDLLVELHTEELPPKALSALGQAFHQQIRERLEKLNLNFSESKWYATPRRLAVLVKQLSRFQAEQIVERRGPAWQVAFNEQGEPTPACLGFANSCGVTAQDLISIKNAQGEWVGYLQKVAGKDLVALAPDLIEQAIAALPIPRRMRWGEGEIAFVRPVHSVILMYGTEIIPAMLLGCQTGNRTRGHRFHSTDWLEIPKASLYADTLRKHGHVMADFAERRTMILELSAMCAAGEFHEQAEVLFNDEQLLDEVTGLVEWPVAINGRFDSAFLQLPSEVLISAMQDHQRYFPIKNQQNQLMPAFMAISNIASHDPQRVIHGNERVLRARLADAAFFFAEDKKESLIQRLERLRGIIFQAKLGTLYDKAQRISQLSSKMAQQLGVDVAQAERTGWLAKTDLTTNMVSEFPELQGVMGYYYALHDGESESVAQAIAQHYLPRFAGDALPQQAIAQVVAMADRIDTLIGAFGIQQIPTGDKDPYGLRRAALSVLRILIENKLDLDLRTLFSQAASLYSAPLENKDVIEQTLNFTLERLRAWYLEQGITADVFAAVSTLGVTRPFDIHQRMHAVQAFKQWEEAEALCAANKRVSNILAKYNEEIDVKEINQAYFELAAEKELAEQLQRKSEEVAKLYQLGQYEQILLQLASLRQPIDNFFEQVMVMVDDQQQRENRLLMLMQLRNLFLRVADVALLQIS